MFILLAKHSFDGNIRCICGYVELQGPIGPLKMGVVVGFSFNYLKSFWHLYFQFNSIPFVSNKNSEHAIFLKLSIKPL